MTQCKETIDICGRARDVLSIEASAVSGLLPKIGESFEEAIYLILASQGRVIITGMGKPGLIARKISATLASTGTPSFFLHPAEAIHGDLGMVLSDDVVIAISNSGKTEEIVRLVPQIKAIGCKLIAMTGKQKTFLAMHSDVVLDVGVEQEACSLGLAPTASTTAALAMGDAIAIVLLDIKGFQTKDYALLHPGGDLGRRLMLKVSDVMQTSVRKASIHKDRTVKDALEKITVARTGAIAIVDENNKLLGIFTDGDLRRLYKENMHIANEPIGSVMTASPITLASDRFAMEALRLMQEKKIDEVPIVNADHEMVGFLDIQDLLRLDV